MTSPHVNDSLDCVTSFVSRSRENVSVLVMQMIFLFFCLFSWLFNRTFFLLCKGYGYVDILVSKYSL